MADKFDLTPVDHDPFEGLGAIPTLLPKPNVLQAGPTSLQGNVAGLGLPAGVFGKYVGEQVNNLYDIATLPGDVALGKVDPNSPEGMARAFGMSMMLAGGPVVAPSGGVSMGFGKALSKVNNLIDKYALPKSAEELQAATSKEAVDAWAKKLTDEGVLVPKEKPPATTSWQTIDELEAELKAILNPKPIPFKPEPKLTKTVEDMSDAEFSQHLASGNYKPPQPKPLDHSYWGNEILSHITDTDPSILKELSHQAMIDSVTEHVKDLAPEAHHTAIDAAAKEYVPAALQVINSIHPQLGGKPSAEALDFLKAFTPEAWQKDFPEMAKALPGVQKFYNLQSPTPKLTPVDHDPFDVGPTVTPVDMTSLYGGLSMDPAARMQRAREMGFNPDLTFYHGRGDAPGFQNNAFKDPAFKSERAIFATDRPEIAERYAGTNDLLRRSEIMPLLARMKNPKVIDVKGQYYGGWMTHEINAARAEGHDALIIHNMVDYGGPQTQYAIFDPKNLRSKFAAFNPLYSDSANLLSTRGHPFTLTPVDHNPWEDRTK